MKRNFPQHVCKEKRGARAESRRPRSGAQTESCTRRLFDVRVPLAEVTQRTIQAHIDARTQEVGLRKKLISRETVQKELGTLSAVWNKWGVPQGLVNGPPPITNLTFPKGNTKPPFQTREQVERQIARQKLSPAVPGGVRG